MWDTLPLGLQKVLSQTPELRQAYLVGGGVRDWLRGQPVKDYDIEVYGTDYETLVKALSRWGKTDLVGRSFGVAKLALAGHIVDFSIARKYSKTAAGHKGFEVTLDPHLTPQEAASRRDFTINALMYDPREKNVLDFYSGQMDLSRRILRHVSPAFVEDPLRVLRGMQFVGRFELHAAPDTLALCQSISPSFSELALDRVRDEWIKWASLSRKPSLGLHFLKNTGWLDHFPEVARLAGTRQDPDWHPEGDVFVHSLHACDFMAKNPDWSALPTEDRAVYMLAALAHDFGKPETTTEAIKEGKRHIVSPGHCEAGKIHAETFLRRIGAPKRFSERVVPLVAEHLSHLQLPTDRAVRRLAKRLEPDTIDGWALVVKADHGGRPPLPADDPEGLKLWMDKAEDLAVKAAAPVPLLRGKDLLARGWPAGPKMGQFLKRAYESQLDGEFTDTAGALLWLEGQERPH